MKKDFMLAVNGITDDDYYYPTAYAASQNLPTIPWDILDAVLTNGGAYYYGCYTIKRVSRSYVNIQTHNRTFQGPGIN